SGVLLLHAPKIEDRLRGSGNWIRIETPLVSERDRAGHLDVERNPVAEPGRIVTGLLQKHGSHCGRIECPDFNRPGFFLVAVITRQRDQSAWRVHAHSLPSDST